MSILVFIQQENGNINRLSKEAISGAQQLGEELKLPVNACVFNETAASRLLEYELNKVILVKNEELNEYNPIKFSAALEKVIKNDNYSLIIFGHTYEARDWIPRLSARLDLPFISDCIGSYREDSINSGLSSIINTEVDLSEVVNNIKPKEKFQETKGDVDLTRADVIVSVGRGIGKEENMPIASELAKSLNAEIAASRPVVDYGWLGHERQVGSSGQTVSPKMYLAIGMSGAVQHQVGMKGSNCIVAINKDPKAPIFEIADYGIVEDLFEIIPKLTEKLNTR